MRGQRRKRRVLGFRLGKIGRSDLTDYSIGRLMKIVTCFRFFLYYYYYLLWRDVPGELFINFIIFNLNDVFIYFINYQLQIFIYLYY